MRILHLLSQNHLTGAEVYAATLAEQQIRDGHQVYQISNGFFYPTVATTQVLEVETKASIGFFKNVKSLREFINTNRIQVIHTHSRAAAKLAWYSRIGLKVALVSTVHGRQHPSISKKLFSKYGEFIISVCENIHKQLYRDFNYNLRRMQIVRNPIAENRFSYLPTIPKSRYQKVAVIGRTTGPKKTRTELAILNLYLQQPDCEISVVGGKIADLELPDEIKEKLSEIHVESLASPDYQKYDLIIGAGRVCMEALITGIPTIAFGEAEYVGLVQDRNFYQAVQSNFGDVHLDQQNPTLDDKQFRKDLTTFLSVDELAQLSKRAQLEFGLKPVSDKIIRTYESAFFLRHYTKWIPTLMYHKIPDIKISSQHRIFVTKKNFERHLKLFKFLGFTSLTFSELEKYRRGEWHFKNFPKKPLILTFDDGYRDNLENASPLLEKYGFYAQLFLLANTEIKSNQWDISSTEPAHEIVSGDERQKWLTSRFEIGSHGFSHHKITEMTDQEALHELTQSKLNLEAEFGMKVNTFAFTYGYTSSRAAELAQLAGYSYAVNTDTGGLLLEEAPYQIFRANVFPEDNIFSLWKKTSSWYRKYYFNKRNK